MMQLLFGVILGLIVVLTALLGGLYVNKQKAESTLKHPRKLTEAQREKFLKLLSESPKGEVNVTAVKGDFEAITFAKELDGLFNIAGWFTQGVYQSGFVGNPTGLILTVNNAAETPSYAGLLQSAFRAIGFPASAEIHREDPAQSLNLTVGHNPEPE